MAASATPHFHNDKGHARIKVGVKEFMCCGASAPYDHPHVFLDMGGSEEIVCPYCSTLFVHDAQLDALETEPAGCVYHKPAA